MKIGTLGQNPAVAASKYVATRSILNPILWLALIVTPVSIAGATLAEPPLVSVLIFLAASPPIVAMVAYLYFMIRDPNRLQSEEFVLQQQWAAQIGDNRTHEVINVPVERASLTANAAATEAGANG